MDVHKQEIDFKLMKYRINSLKQCKGEVNIYLSKDSYGFYEPGVGGDKYTLTKIEQRGSVTDKTMKVTFEMEFVNE